MIKETILTDEEILEAVKKDPYTTLNQIMINKREANKIQEKQKEIDNKFAEIKKDIILIKGMVVTNINLLSDGYPHGEYSEYEPPTILVTFNFLGGDKSTEIVMEFDEPRRQK